MRLTKFAFGVALLGVGGLGFALGNRVGGAREAPRRAVTLEVHAPGSVPRRLSEALALPDELERSVALIELLDGLGPEHIAMVEEVLNDAWLPRIDPAWPLLAEWEVRFDPEAAFGRAEQWEDPNWGRRAVARAWARKDPEAARTAIDSLPRDESLTLAVMRGWFESGQLEEAWDYVENELATGAERQRSIAVLISRMLLSDGIDATVAWVEAIPDDAPRRFKLQVFRRLSRQLARLDPPGAAAFAERHVDDEIGRRGKLLNLYEHVAKQWVLSDPQSAMQWLSGLPDGDLRDKAVAGAYRFWLRIDQEGAIAWAREIGDGPWLDPGVALVATYLSLESPEEGLDWAGRIHGEERRNRITVLIGQRWLASDPAAAESWLAGAPPELREKIREKTRPANKVQEG